MEKKEATTSAQPTVPVVRKSIFAKKKASADTPSHQQVTTTSNPTSSAPEQLPPSLVAAAGVDGTSAADAPPVEVAVSSAPIQSVKRRSLFGRKVQTTTSVKDDVVLTTTPVVITQAPPATTMAADEEEDANITPPATSTPHTLSIGSGAVVAERAEDSEDRTTTTATSLAGDDETAVTKLVVSSSSAGVVMAESDSSINSTDRPQTPAMPQSITLSRYMMRVCEITGRLIPVLGEKVGAGGTSTTSSGSTHHHHNHQQQSGMMGMTESSSTGGDDDNDEAGVFNNNLPPMLAYLHYLPYSHYMDAPVPRALLRTRATNTTTTAMTVNNNINVNGNDDEGEQLPQSVRPLSRLVVGLVDTTLGGAVMADATTAQSMTCHEASRPTSPSTRTPLGNNNVHATSSFAEGDGFVESRGGLIGTKRSRSSLDGGAGAEEAAEEGGAAAMGDGQQHPSTLPPRPMSPQALNTSFGTTTSVSGCGVAAAGSCPSSLYSPGYPSTTTHTSTLLGSQQNKHHNQNSSSTVGNNPFYVPVGFGVVPPNVVCRAIQEPVYLTLRFEKCLAACYTVCAKVVPEMQLGWSVHSTTMFYCHVFIRAHFWQDPESQQQRSESSCSPRRRNIVGGGGGRNTASSPTTANPSTTATPTKPTTPTCPPPSFYDVPSTNHNNNNKPSPSISQQQAQPQAPVEIKRIQTMDPIILVAAALFLATKIENFKKPLDDIIGRIFDRHPNRPEHAKYKAMVLQAEIMLLATLGGNLTVIHPFDEIRQLSMGNQEVAKRANKLYSYTTMTPVALYVPRRELAASLVLLVAEEAKLLPSTSVPSSSSVPRSSSVRSASGNRPPSSSANPFARLLNGDATTMTAADIDAGIPQPVALTAVHFETVVACLSAMMLVTEKKSGVTRLDNRVQVKKSLIAHSEYNSRLQRNNTNNTKK